MTKFFIRRVLAFSLDFFITFYGAVFAVLGVTQYSGFAENASSSWFIFGIGSLMFFLWIIVYLIYIPMSWKRLNGATIGNYIFKVGVVYKRNTVFYHFYREVILKYVFATSMSSLAFVTINNLANVESGNAINIVQSHIAAIFIVGFLLWMWPGEPTHKRNVLDRFSKSFSVDLKNTDQTKIAKESTELRHKKQKNRAKKASK